MPGLAFIEFFGCSSLSCWGRVRMITVCACECVCPWHACVMQGAAALLSSRVPVMGLLWAGFSHPLQPPALDKGACWCEQCYDSSISSICGCVVWLQHWHCEAFTILLCCQRVSAGARRNSCAACIEGSKWCCCCLGQLGQIAESYCCSWSYFHACQKLQTWYSGCRGANIPICSTTTQPQAYC